MATENQFRKVLEEIVLESQKRANTAKYRLDITKRSFGYEADQTKMFEMVYDELQGLFEYIANQYGGLIENEQEERKQ